MPCFTGSDCTADSRHRKKICSFDNIIFTQSLEEAVEECRKAANPGDAVLLSPACASWGCLITMSSVVTCLKS